MSDLMLRAVNEFARHWPWTLAYLVVCVTLTLGIAVYDLVRG